MKSSKVVLTLVPFAWTVGGIPWVNRVHPFVLGLPFMVFYILLGIIVAFLCLLAMYHIDSRRPNS
ncbi:MAG: DUF3311 domain-containing protein [Holophaga sp.]|jgi:hypothetical protein